VPKSALFRHFVPGIHISEPVLGRVGPRLLIIILLFTSVPALNRCVRAQTGAARFGASSGSELSQNTGTHTLPPRSGGQTIPLAQVADRADELDLLLREIRDQLPTRSELLRAQQKVQTQEQEIQERYRRTTDLLAGTPMPLEIEDEQRYWHSRSQQYAAQRKVLTSRASKLEEQIQVLESQQPGWQATWDQIHDMRGIAAVVTRVQQQLNRIQAARLEAQEQLNVVLTLQSQISEQDQEVSDILARVRQTQERNRSRILEQDSLPLWHARELSQTGRVAATLSRPFDRTLTSATEFLRARGVAMIALAIAYLFSLLGVFRLRHHLASTAQPDAPREIVQILKAPFSVALLVAVMIGTGECLAWAPIGVAFSVYLLYLIPLLRLFSPILSPVARIFLHVSGLFYALEGLYLLAQLPPLLGRQLSALLVLAAIACLGWLTRSSRVNLLLDQSKTSRILKVAIRADLVLLIGSLAANIDGFVSLAQILGVAALIGPFVALSLYCGARVLTLLVTVILQTSWFSKVLEMHADAVQRWTGRVLVATASVLWLKAMLQLLTVYDAVLGAVSHVFRRSIGFQRLHFTLGGTLGIALTLLGGYALANALVFVLRKAILSKLPLQRGLPYAISTTTYYVLLLLVALAGLSTAGVELNRFTLLTGALGVGLGFGLQNIVNNFVSGLILLFERPIHVGDTVDVGGVVGTVRRIGARSSTVLTFQGAEVIVPNSNLLSNQLVNWTLSSQLRRVDIPVGIAYGTDPDRVIRLLVGVAESQPGVLLERPPEAFFIGFGESALNFELRFWCGRQDTWFQLRSDVTVALVKALREAGIEIPLPQRDLHVRSIALSADETLAGGRIRARPSPESGERIARV
jgi:potassium-dependent mechanosensitive channel